MSSQQLTPPNPVIPTIPVGTIVAFYQKNTANIPSGWILCNSAGQKSTHSNNYDGLSVPDLTGLTLIGQGGKYNMGDSGGEVSHTLTLQEMPNHHHQFGGYINRPCGNNGSDSGDDISAPDCNWWSDGNQTMETGGSVAHNNMQPYRVVYYIMFVGVSTASGLYDPNNQSGNI